MSDEWVPHELDPESDQIREVFARFGAALYSAQVLEQAVAMLLATLFGPGEDWLKQHGIDDLLDRNFRATFGQLKKQLEGKAPDELLEAIGDSVQLRNRLAHHYFWDYAVEFTKTDGRNTMIGELAEIDERFQNLTTELDALQARWRQDHGISDEDIQKQFDKLMSS